jgi:hypothetical protein
MLKSKIPTRGTTVPAGLDWFHEIKHDGYGLIIQRDGKRVRLWTRNGRDWSDRFPLITEPALRNRNSSFVIDGEAVLLGVDGRSDFNGLHSRRHDDEVQRFCSSRSRTASLRPGLADLASGMVVVFCHTSPVSVDYRSIIFQKTGKPLPRRHDRHLRAIVDG